MISVILPSIRPHLVKRAFDSIAPAAAYVKHQVVVVADFGPEDWPNCTWIVRERRGPIDAINLAMHEVTGEWLFLMNDESTLGVGSLASLYTYSLMHPDRVLTPTHIPPFNFSYYGKQFAPFPFVHVDVVKKLGGFFDLAYQGFYADPDFSLRAHAHGIPVEEVGDAAIHHTHHGDDDSKRQRWDAHFDADRATFRSRWDHLGAFADPS